MLSLIGRTSKMISYGWKFDFTHDGSVQSKSYKRVGMKCGSKAKWYGWSEHSHVGTLRTSRLKGSGEVTLDFGNCWNAGNVKVYLDATLMATAPAGRKSVVITFTFTPNSVLKIKDEDGNAVILLNSITFSCYGMFYYII